MASRQLAAKELASRDFRHQLEGYGLTTAQILYRLPDHPRSLEPNGCPLYAFHIRRKRALMSIGTLRAICSFAGTAATGHAHP